MLETLHTLQGWFFLSLSRDHVALIRIEFIGAPGKTDFPTSIQNEINFILRRRISLSFSFSLERTSGKRRVCESVWQKNSNDNGDGSRYLFASDAKNYTWSGEETLRGRGESRDREEELQWSRNFVFFFLFFIFSCAPHLSRGRRRGWKNPGPRCFTPPSLLDVPSTLDPPPFSNRCCILAIRYLYHFLSFFFFFENSCPRRNRRMNYFCGNEKRDVVKS